MKTVTQKHGTNNSGSRNRFPCLTRSEWNEATRPDPRELDTYQQLANANKLEKE